MTRMQCSCNIDRAQLYNGRLPATAEGNDQHPANLVPNEHELTTLMDDVSLVGFRVRCPISNPASRVRRGKSFDASCISILRAF